MKEEIYIKGTLLDYESPMDMDAIWSDLNKALDKAESGTPPPVLRTQETSHVRKYLPLLLLLLVSGCGFYAYKNLSLFSEASTASEVIPVKLKNESQTKVEENTNTSETTPDSYKTKSVSHPVSDESKTTNHKKKSTPKKATSKEVITPSKKLATQPSSTTNPNFVKATSTGRSLTPPPTANKPGSPQSNYQNNEVVAAPPRSESSQKISSAALAMPAQLEGLAVFNSEVSPLDFTRTVNPDFVFAKVARSRRIVPEKEKAIWRLGLHSGMTSAIGDVTIEGMSASGLVISSDSETIISQRLNKPTFGIQLEKVFPSGVKLGTGLNYINQGQTIARIDTLEVSERTFTTLGEPALNDFGMTSVTSTVTTIIETTISKQVNDVNIKMLQVPLTIGYQKQIAKVDIGIASGLGFNFVLEQEQSPSLTENEISPLSLPTLSLSGVVDLQLGYTFGDDFRVYASAFGGRHLSNKFINPDSDLRAAKSILNHYGLRAGVSFML